MNTAEKLKWLHDNYGHHIEVRERRGFWGALARLLSQHGGGWISITDHVDHWFVLWTSSQHTHNAMLGPAIGADFTKGRGDRFCKGGINGAWKTAVTLWPVRSKLEAEAIFWRVKQLVNTAFDSRQ